MKDECLFMAQDMIGSDGAIRTRESWSQSPLPYRLATPLYRPATQRYVMYT